MTEKRKVVLITGASTGLGLATGQLLIQEDRFHVILTARKGSLSRFDKLGIKNSENIWIRELDVTDLDQRHKVVNEIRSKLDGIDILINNAGYSLRAVVEHVTEMDRLQQMRINFRSPMGLIRLVLPDMRRKRWGRIINVSSVGGMMAMPTMAVYSASKFALEGASESLWYEVRPWNISVTLLQPGFVNSSGFTKTRLTPQSECSIKNDKDPYYQHYISMTPFIEKMMRRSYATPESVAKKILKTINRHNPPLRVAATPDAVLFALLRRLLPRSWYHRLLYLLLPNVRNWGRLTEEESSQICF